MKIGAKADVKGDRIAADPNALNTAKANQKTMEIPIAIPIPNNVPRLPMIKEKGSGKDIEAMSCSHRRK